MIQIDRFDFLLLGFLWLLSLTWDPAALVFAQEVRFREFVDSTNLQRWQGYEIPASQPMQYPALGEKTTDSLLWFHDEQSPGRLVGRLIRDQQNFYSVESLSMFGVGLVVGGAMANTSIDESLQKHFRSSVLGATSDDWFESLHASKELGNGAYTLPVYAIAWGGGALFPTSEVAMTTSRWGERSIRGFAVGVLPVVLMQRVTGGSRPGEIPEGSDWHPFKDNNGISGHAFMGSLPFITAAKMSKNIGYKTLFYAGSAIAPLSRVNDGAHYPSQVALGWWVAFLAASAVDATDDPSAKWRFLPYATAEGPGLSMEYRF